MSLHDRAAQFAPFAALTGHEDAIEETSRLTDDKIVLDDNAIEKINKKIYDISQHLSEQWNVSITYFRPDTLKSGMERFNHILSPRYIKKWWCVSYRRRNHKKGRCGGEDNYYG